MDKELREIGSKTQDRYNDTKTAVPIGKTSLQITII